MTERWWVIEESALQGALRRASDGDDPSVVLLELTANADSESVEGNEP